MKLDSQIPSGPLESKWTQHKSEMKLVNPANRRKHTILIVGTGLAGASAAASLGEMGYHVKAFFFHESARRAHSIAAQGGINAAKNYQNDGDSVHRLFYDTIKGGDFRSREANVHRLAEVSTNIIDQCAAQGVPFAREYGGQLSNRSFGGTQVSRTFYARGQTGQQLLIGAYSSMMRQVNEGNVELYERREMLDLVITGGKARGIVIRNLVTGELETFSGDAVVLCTGGYSNVYYLSTNAKNCNVTAAWRAYKRGAAFANPCFTQIHPTCIPVTGDYQSKLTLMSESLRNDGRVWVPKKQNDQRSPQEIPESERDYYLERRYPAYGNLAPRDIASRAAKLACDEGHGVGPSRQAVYLDFADAIKRLGAPAISAKYGNLFEIYEQITNEDPYRSPMRMYPAPHYTMGGLWVDYHLQSTIPGLFVAGEANFSDHGANRLGASALMQGLADGYFVLPYTLGNYLGGTKLEATAADGADFKEARAKAQSSIDRLFKVGGKVPVAELHRRLGRVMWDAVGMSRNKPGLEKSIKTLQALKEEFWATVALPGDANNLNPELEMAGRVADFMEFGELMARDALTREESCGGHFREEYQTADNEALRDDEKFAHVAAWEYKGEGQVPTRHVEPLHFESIKLAQRSYK